jgi:branched-chain amino acid transport system ATP-binding protein
LGGTLSGGQQQMLAIGQALMAAPRYLLIDEMSLGLAPVIVKRLLGVLTHLKAQGTGILLIEQFTDLALGLAETAIVLRGGKMRFSGDAKTLAADKSLLHQAYFGV